MHPGVDVGRGEVDTRASEGEKHGGAIANKNFFPLVRIIETVDSLNSASGVVSRIGDNSDSQVFCIGRVGADYW